ncbi:MAG: PqiC family protein [Methyloprofundus sp.]|nr:PqiC family protein [Methyloprofundus sp.]
MQLPIMKIIGVLLALSACSVSPKSTLYLLRTVEPTQAKFTAQQPVNIYLQPVNFPDYLDRPQMVLRKDAVTLARQEFHRWGEPLNMSFERVFKENMQMRLASATVLSKKTFSTMAFDYQLALEVIRFDTNAQQQAILQLHWALLNGLGNKLLFASTETITVPIAVDDFHARVEAQSEAIAILADKVAIQIVRAMLSPDIRG